MRKILVLALFCLLMTASCAMAAQQSFEARLEEATPATLEQLTAAFGKPVKAWTNEDGQKCMQWKTVKATCGDTRARVSVNALPSWNFEGLRIGAKPSAIPFDKLEAAGWVQIGPTGRSTTAIFRRTISPELAKFLAIDPGPRQKQIVSIWWFTDKP